MSNYASTRIEIAKKEINYFEKASLAFLDDKTKNAGHKNITKYARDLDKINGFYNFKKQGVPWCAVWNDWTAVKAYGVSEAKRITFHTNCGAGCSESAKAFQKAGRWYDYPEIGDEIFFGTKTNCYHTGLVIDVDKNYVYTIEGNTSSETGVVANGGVVRDKKYPLNYSKIAGYGRPLYDEETKSNKKPNASCIKKGDTGVQVENLQKFLNWYGDYKLDVDGDFGKLTETALKDFQKNESLEVDGKFGPASSAKAKDCEKNNKKKEVKEKYNGTFPKIPNNSSLKKGSAGAQVKNLQKFLNWYGNYGLDVDGDFGTLTDKAVRDFQRKEKLEVDGKFGPASLAQAKKIKK